MRELDQVWNAQHAALSLHSAGWDLDAITSLESVRCAFVEAQDWKAGHAACRVQAAHSCDWNVTLVMIQRDEPEQD